MAVAKLIYKQMMDMKRIYLLMFTPLIGISSCFGQAEVTVVTSTPMSLLEIIQKANGGDASTQFALGEFYFFGEGVVQNHAEAVKWWRKAAEQGYAEAQHNLGVCYDNGEGVVQNHAEAVKWYRKAAEQGYAEAQLNLGVCYAKGEGVVQNHAEAVKWWRKAAEQGYAEAQHNLGVCYYNGDGVGQDYGQAYRYLTMPQDWKSSACSYIGEMYYYGRYLKKDYAKAFEYLKKAADEEQFRCGTAMRLLAACYRYGLGTAIDVAKEEYWMQEAVKHKDEKAMMILR